MSSDATENSALVATTGTVLIGVFICSGLKLTDADQELYKNFPLVISERWQAEVSLENSEFFFFRNNNCVRLSTVPVRRDSGS
jgi:hypothetical protein